MPSITTSSSSAPARAAARSPTGPRADRQAHPPPRTRRTPAARGRELEPRWSSAKHRYRTASSGTTRPASRSRPHPHYFVGGNTSFYGAPCSGCASATSARCSTPAAFHLPGRSPSPISPPTTPRPSRSSLSMAQARGGPHRADAPYAFRSGVSRPAHPGAADDLGPQGSSPFSLPLGVDLDQSQPVTWPASNARPAAAIPACEPRPTRTSAAWPRPLLKAPNVTLLTGRKVDRLETDAAGKAVTEVVCETAQGEERWTGDIVVLAAGAANSAAACWPPPAPRTRAASPTARPGRAQLHVPHPDVDGLAAPTRRKFPKTLAVNDFYWGAAGYDKPMGHIQLLEYMSGQTLGSALGLAAASPGADSTPWPSG